MEDMGSLRKNKLPRTRQYLLMKEVEARLPEMNSGIVEPKKLAPELTKKLGFVITSHNVAGAALALGVNLPQKKRQTLLGGAMRRLKTLEDAVAALYRDLGVTWPEAEPKPDEFLFPKGGRHER